MSVRAFLSKNIVAVVMVPVIISAHYGWYKLQEVESLVSAEERNNLAITKMLKNMSLSKD